MSLHAAAHNLIEKRDQMLNIDDQNSKKMRKNGCKCATSVLPKTIGSIFSSACGSRTVKEMFMHASDDESKELTVTDDSKGGEIEEKRDQSALAKLARRRGRRTDQTSSVSRIFRIKSNRGFHLKKWKITTIKTRKEARLIHATHDDDEATRIKGVELMRNNGGRVEAEEKVVDGGRSVVGVELCKKRILMGEKCRPLNLSGVLHYDEDGFILAEN